MAIDERAIHDLVLLAYDAGLSRRPWADFLASLQSLLGSTHTTLLAQELTAARARVLGFTGFSMEAKRSYEEYYRTRNVFLQHGARLIRPGIVRTNAMMCPDRLLLKSEYFNDFMQPNDVRFTLGTTTTVSDCAAVHLTVWRSNRAGEYGDDEVAAMGLLSPHLQRAFQVHDRLGLTDQRLSSLEAALDRSGRAIALLDGSRRSCFLSAQMDLIAQRADGIQLLQGRLVATVRESDRLLQNAIANVLEGGAGGTVVVLRNGSESPYRVLVAPCGQAAFGMAQGTRVLVIVHDPDVVTNADAVSLQSAYGLTAREAEVLGKLSEGLTPEEIATHIGVSIETVRTHLKHVMNKTGVTRQAGLVRLVLLAHADV